MRGGEHRLRLVLPARRVQPAANGLGELVIVGVPAAIVNAVFNATGKRVRDLTHHPGHTALSGIEAVTVAGRFTSNHGG
jgi:hypothetical protein